MKHSHHESQNFATTFSVESIEIFMAAPYFLFFSSATLWSRTISHVSDLPSNPRGFRTSVKRCWKGHNWPSKRPVRRLLTVESSSHPIPYHNDPLCWGLPTYSPYTRNDIGPYLHLVVRVSIHTHEKTLWCHHSSNPFHIYLWWFCLAVLGQQCKKTWFKHSVKWQ